MKGYNNIFTGVEKVFIPKLNKYKKKLGVYDVTGKELVKYLKKTHKNVTYQTNPETIIQNILKLAKPNNIVAFMGSKNFDGMIQEMIQKIK